MIFDPFKKFDRTVISSVLNASAMMIMMLHIFSIGLRLGGYGGHSLIVAFLTDDFFKKPIVERAAWCIIVLHKYQVKNFSFCIRVVEIFLKCCMRFSSYFHPIFNSNRLANCALYQRLLHPCGPSSVNTTFPKLTFMLFSAHFSLFSRWTHWKRRCSCRFSTFAYAL